MLYPKDIASKLGFDQIIDLAKVHCQTDRGIEHFERLRYASDIELVQQRLQQTNEMKNLLEKGGFMLDLNLDEDLRFKEAKATGFFYVEEELVFIYDILENLQQAISFFGGKADEYYQLHTLFTEIDLDHDLVEELGKLLDADGKIKPNATKAYQKINAQISTKEKGILSSSQSIFNSFKEKGFLADTELGIKNGRVVLPVLSEHKRKVDGLLIDQSNTGKISYIEPLALVALNNELAELIIKQRQELIKILKAISAKVVLNVDSIKNGVQRLSVLDFIRAKAKLAIDTNGVMPEIAKETLVEEARHPLLEKRLSDVEDKIVPLDYSMNDKERIIVISGPNAGGKSVALKTVGLLQFMLQSGFLVSCSERSKFQLFEHIFIDIGDNQSIESDLSTYSSHLKAAKHIINHCNEQTLVLMDEIGTGTDPMFGGPMAEAILDEIHNKKAFGVITTHFSNIKAQAEKLPRTVNAAMLFDVENLKPLYQLKVGQPGSSFSFEVATKIGLNRKVVKKARALSHTEQYEYDKLLAELQTEKEEIALLKNELKSEKSKFSKTEEEYRELKESLDKQKKEILSQAKKKAQQIVEDSNKAVEKTIREIQESKADKKKTAIAREKLSSKIESPQAKAVTKKQQDLKVGDRVQIGDTENFGEILEIKKNTATIVVGAIKTKTNVANLSKVGAATEKKVKKYISSSSYSNKQEKFSTELDVRGFRTEEALNEVDSWIDSAIILGFSSLRLIHGKGNGILKEQIRRHLKPNHAIKSIQYERVDLGGAGVSLIELA